MSKKTTIDWSIYVTATDYAKELTEQGKPTSVQQIHNWRKRDKIKAKYFPEFDKYYYVRGSIKVKGY